METLKIFSLANAFAHWGEIWNGTVYRKQIFPLFSNLHLLLFIHEFDADRQTETWERK